MLKFPLLFITNFLSISTAQPSPFGFKVQFIGKNRYVSPSQERSRDFCNSIQCIRDADILFTRSSQYEASDPCDDFANFTLGTAMDVGPPNDRSSQRGFMKEVEEILTDRFRRVMDEKVKKKDGKFVKSVKKLFRKILKSDHALRHIEGHRDFVEFLQMLG